MSTINRRGLKGKVQRGELLVKCDGVYSDDYAYDAAVNFKITEFVPAYYFPSFNLWIEESGFADEYNEKVNSASPELHAERQYHRNHFWNMYDDAKKHLSDGLVFDEHDFKGYGYAWQNDDGLIHLSFGYRSYTFKPVVADGVEVISS